jgi:hypothetical protein
MSVERGERQLTPSDPVLRYEPVRMPADTPPLLMVVVDTEEEFDWSAPFSRAHVGVRAMQRIGRLQEVLSRFGLEPTYVVDFPIASQPDGYAPLKEIADSGAARIGAHLHPWVNPPFDEEVGARTSYGCELGAALEAEKIRVLQAEIAERFERVPRVYKAGRYGFGRTTVAALESLSFDVDVSINPRMNFASDGGPSFETFDTTPFFFGRTGQLLEIPCSTDYTGVAGRHGPGLHRTISRPAFERAHLPGVMARLGILNRVMLTPEGSTLRELKALTRRLLRQGIRTFSFTLHSPSVEPGCTPYVRTARDLAEFLDRIAGYCEFFLGEVGGAPSTPEDFKDLLRPRGGTGDGTSRHDGRHANHGQERHRESARALAAR